MPLTTTSIQAYHSAGKTTPEGDQGGAISTTQLTDQTLVSSPFTFNTLFSNISSADRQLGGFWYTCIYLKNNDASITASNVKVWVSTDTPGADNIRLGYSGNAININEQLITATTAEIFTTGTVAGASWGTELSDIRKRQTQVFASPDHPAIGKKITEFICLARSSGSGHTGNVSFKLWDANWAVKATFGSVAASSITTATTGQTITRTLDNPSLSYTVALNDRIGMEWLEGTSTRKLQFNRHSTTETDPNGNIIAWDGTTNITVNYDLHYTIKGVGNSANRIAPSGITFENANTRETAIKLPNLTAGSRIGLWVRLEVPAASGAFPNGKYAIKIEYDSPA